MFGWVKKGWDWCKAQVSSESIAAEMEELKKSRRYQDSIWENIKAAIIEAFPGAGDDHINKMTFGNKGLYERPIVIVEFGLDKRSGKELYEQFIKQRFNLEAISVISYPDPDSNKIKKFIHFIFIGLPVGIKNSFKSLIVFLDIIEILALKGKIGSYDKLPNYVRMIPVKILEPFKFTADITKRFFSRMMMPDVCTTKDTEQYHRELAINPEKASQCGNFGKGLGTAFLTFGGFAVVYGVAPYLLWPQNITASITASGYLATGVLAGEHELSEKTKKILDHPDTKRLIAEQKSQEAEATKQQNESKQANNTNLLPPIRRGGRYLAKTPLASLATIYEPADLNNPDKKIKPKQFFTFESKSQKPFSPPLAPPQATDFNDIKIEIRSPKLEALHQKTTATTAKMLAAIADILPNAVNTDNDGKAAEWRKIEAEEKAAEQQRNTADATISPKTLTPPTVVVHPHPVTSAERALKIKQIQSRGVTIAPSDNNKFKTKAIAILVNPPTPRSAV